jgi:hypothetical protein
VFADHQLLRLHEGVVAAAAKPPRPSAPSPAQEESDIRQLSAGFADALYRCLGPERVAVTVNGSTVIEDDWQPAHPALRGEAPLRVVKSLLHKYSSHLPSPEQADPLPAVRAFLSALTRQYDKLLNPPSREDRRRRALDQGAGAEH